MLNEQQFYLFSQILTGQTGDQPYSDTSPYGECSLAHIYPSGELLYFWNGKNIEKLHEGQWPNLCDNWANGRAPLLKHPITDLGQTNISPCTCSLPSKNRLGRFVTEIKSKQDFKRLSFPFWPIPNCNTTVSINFFKIIWTCNLWVGHILQAKTSFVIYLAELANQPYNLCKAFILNFVWLWRSQI